MVGTPELAGHMNCLKGVPAQPSPPEVDVCCLPGDITVTKIPTGYLLGRALEPRGSGRGPWWEYISIVASYEDAVHQARTVARMYDVKAWLHTSGDDYDRLWPETSRHR